MAQAQLQAIQAQLQAERNLCEFAYIFHVPPETPDLINVEIQQRQGAAAAVQFVTQITVLCCTIAIQKPMLEQRFVADVEKDALDGTRVRDFKNLSKQCFPIVDPAGHNFHHYLDEFEAEINNFARDFETIMKNILKMSTNGINTKISNASYIQYESGFSSQSLCRKTKNTSLNVRPGMDEYVIVGTAFAGLDTAGKEAPTFYFQNIANHLQNAYFTFDHTYSDRLGFPYELNVSCIPIHNIDNGRTGYYITINWTIPELANLQAPQPVGERARPTPGEKWLIYQVICASGVDGRIISKNVELLFSSAGNDAVDFENGNSVKNGYINDLDRNDPADLDKIFEIFLKKELGDVAQVWMYLGFLFIQRYTEYTNLPEPERGDWNGIDDAMAIKQDNAAITTDSVVYSLCKLFMMSCIYTGSREGVTNGCCTLKHFFVGENDLGANLRLMKLAYLQRMKANNAAVRIGLLIMMNDFKNFSFYVVNHSPRRQQANTKRILGNEFFLHRTTKDEAYKEPIKAYFRAAIGEIDECNGRIDILITHIQQNDPPVLVQNSAELSQLYQVFCDEINTRNNTAESFQYPQIISKSITGSHYLVHPTLFLDRLVHTMNTIILAYSPIFYAAYPELRQNQITQVPNIFTLTANMLSNRIANFRPPNLVGGKLIKQNTIKELKGGSTDLNLDGWNIGYYELLLTISISFYFVKMMLENIRDIFIEIFPSIDIEGIQFPIQIGPQQIIDVITQRPTLIYDLITRNSEWINILQINYDAVVASTVKFQNGGLNIGTYVMIDGRYINTPIYNCLEAIKNNFNETELWTIGGPLYNALMFSPEVNIVERQFILEIVNGPDSLFETAINYHPPNWSQAQIDQIAQYRRIKNDQRQHREQRQKQAQQKARGASYPLSKGILIPKTPSQQGPNGVNPNQQWKINRMRLPVPPSLTQRQLTRGGKKTKHNKTRKYRKYKKTRKYRKYKKSKKTRRYK